MIMVTLPSIDVPTAIAAAVLTLLGNQGMRAYFRKKDNITNEIDNEIEWYKRLIELSTQINNSYTILKVAHRDDLVDQERISELFEDVSGKFEQDDHLSHEFKKEVFGEFYKSAVSENREILYETACEQIKEHYAEFFNHIAKSLREFEKSNYSEVESVLISCLIVISTYEGDEIDFNSSIPRKELPDNVDILIVKCEEKIDELEKKKKFTYHIRREIQKLRP